MIAALATAASTAITFVSRNTKEGMLQLVGMVVFSLLAVYLYGLIVFN